jgi:hypothetical protein
MEDRCHRSPCRARPKTVRAYLNGERTPGERKRSVPDALEPFGSRARSGGFRQ